MTISERVSRMGDVITEAFAQVMVRIKRAEARLDELEAHSAKTLADAYRGAHLLNSKYSRGDIVTRAGALWLAMSETTATPGSSGEWKMIAKGAVE